MHRLGQVSGGAAGTHLGARSNRPGPQPASGGLLADAGCPVVAGRRRRQLGTAARDPATPG
jgi:hypothetical protein